MIQKYNYAEYHENRVKTKDLSILHVTTPISTSLKVSWQLRVSMYYLCKCFWVLSDAHLSTYLHHLLLFTGCPLPAFTLTPLMFCSAASMSLLQGTCACCSCMDISFSIFSSLLKQTLSILGVFHDSHIRQSFLFPFSLSFHSALSSQGSPASQLESNSK